MTAWTCVLFDLDGTILDSAPGIIESLAYMFTELGRPVPTHDELLRYVGPPILESFRDLAGLSPRQSAEALDIYRERYLERGTLGSEPFAGVGDVLRRIHASPLPLSLATSKPELPATKMLNLAGLTKYFDVITGASADEVRSSKADVVGEALARLTRFGADVSRPVLVGDREHDVNGGAEHDVPTIFVTWGYGAEAESAGAVAVAETPAELKALLLG